MIFNLIFVGAQSQKATEFFYVYPFLCLRTLKPVFLSEIEYKLVLSYFYRSNDPKFYTV